MQIRATAGYAYRELIISCVIIAVLAAIAIPAYQDYKSKVYYSTVMTAAEPFKTAVNECAKSKKGLTTCHAGSNNIPAAITKPKGPVSSLSVHAGVITVTPVPAHGILETDVYILTPVWDAKKANVVWAASGLGVEHGYAR